ncbi:DUF1003 domain-containing protein [Skermanella pratensis]|uniref:DUF1003 domain-containing protein n=1 Tax=Skermanella pratensis TaxID=2233999 RepID=UPI0013015CC4|nr:DUF1003 domain-containing protein [Skermanella pratensis]
MAVQDDKVGTSKANGVRAHLTDEEHRLLSRLRHRKPARNPPAGEPGPELGGRLADRVASVVGSWRFIIVQSAALSLWIVANLFAWWSAWDPYPFILLNLVLSFQAAFTAPVILMSQNRQGTIDRMNAQHDYEVNTKAELEIELLHQKIDLLREQEIALLLKMVSRFEQRMEAMQERGEVGRTDGPTG